MKTMMKLMALVMAMLLVVGCFAACTQDNGNGTTTEPSTAPTVPTKPTEPSDPGDTNPPDDGKKEYKVYVKTEDGTAVAGVWAQICKEGSTCIPIQTDDNGVAVMRLEAASDYYGSIPGPNGVLLDKEYFGDGFEVTLIYNPSEA